MQTNDADKTEQLLNHMAKRAATRPYYLAGAIKAYQERHQLDRGGLATWLDITDEQLTRLELCGQPDATEPGRSKDVADIAAKFGIDPAKLETILAVGAKP